MYVRESYIRTKGLKGFISRKRETMRVLISLESYTCEYVTIFFGGRRPGGRLKIYIFYAE